MAKYIYDLNGNVRNDFSATDLTVNDVLVANFPAPFSLLLPLQITLADGSYLGTSTFTGAAAVNPTAFNPTIVNFPSPYNGEAVLRYSLAGIRPTAVPTPVTVRVHLAVAGAPIDSIVISINGTHIGTDLNVPVGDLYLNLAGHIVGDGADVLTIDITRSTGVAPASVSIYPISVSDS